MKAHAGGAGTVRRVLTVAHVRVHATHADVMFHESARIYRLPRAHAEFDAMLARLRRAAAARAPVDVQFDSADDEEIVVVARAR